MLDGVEGVGGVEERGVDPFDGKPAAFKDLAGSMSRMWGSFIYGLDPNLSDGRVCAPSGASSSPFVREADMSSRNRFISILVSLCELSGAELRLRC